MSAPSSAPGAQRPGYTPRTAASQRPQRSNPTRGTAAYAQAAPAPRPGGTPAAAGNDSFGERLRAQREAAEKLAQQRLATARDRSTQNRSTHDRPTHTGPDTLTMLAPGRTEATPPRKAVPQRELQPKPAAAEQPKFTFAQEEIVAAQQETAFSPDAPPAAGSRLHPSPVSSAAAPYDRGQPPVADPHAAPRGPSPEAFAAGAPAYRADYRHEDDGMFEEEPQGLKAVPPRASAADYSAAYREFEDEFEDEPRRGGGPLLLLASLAGLAVVGGGLIYWYQQSDGAPAAEVRDVPVISAPQEPVKAEPAPLPEQVQQAAQPTPRKQIYDRIIGEETLEPERLVPTEEEPQLRQIQQPDVQQPRAPDESAVDSQGESPAAVQGTQSTEPLPLPLPPPPGTGEQGNLLVPGMANTETASASPEPASPEPAQLSLPAPGASSASANEAMDAATYQQAAVQPASGDPASPASATAATTTELRDTSSAPQSAGAASPSSIYPELTEPLAYPDPRIATPEPAAASEIDDAGIAALPEPEAAVETEPEAEEVQVEPEVERASDVPLPRAKPEPPAKARTAAKPAPQGQPQRAATAQPSGSGPVQIIPADVATGQAPAQARAVQPQARPATSRARTVGREPDPMAGGNRPARLRSSGIGSEGTSAQPAQAKAPQQVASIAPDRVSSEPQSAGGYVVQLASFRSESEALSEYQRLVQRHPQLVSGLGSRVKEASLGQSGSFYRLGVGPLGDRGAATKLCTDLIAAGEKDCLVRRQ